MNCKKGDMAMIVRGNSHNIGMIVTCLALDPDEWWLGRGGKLVKLGPGWFVDREVTNWDGSTQDIVPDAYMIPIPKDGLEDETIDNKDLETV